MKRGKSVRELLGIRSFTRYGLDTDWGEILFFRVAPTNISVLSSANIQAKIRHLKNALIGIPDLEILCADDSECFDRNRAYLRERMEAEPQAGVRALLRQDRDMLENLQIEMASARQFVVARRCRRLNTEQVFELANATEKALAEEGFEVRRMEKGDIKRFLALYFEASIQGERMPDIDGGQFLE